MSERPSPPTSGEPGSADRRTGAPVPPGGIPGGVGRRATDDIAPEQLSLGRRLRQPRTLLSIAVPVVILLLVARSLPDFRLDRLPGLIGAANPLLLAAAFVAYYVGFPLRGYRWTLLLRGAGTRIGIRDSTEIVFISWLVNCVVPAKLGDIYRAYLLRLNFQVSLSRTFGTVFIERAFDLFAIVLLGLASGYWSFRSGLPGAVQFIFVLGLGVVGILALGLFTLRSFGRRLLAALPVPARIVELYERFEEGVFSIDRRQVPWLGVLTGLIWATEATRLYLVIEALGFPDTHLGISGTFFVALAASLLTAVPLTPAGLGLVEFGIIGILTAVYGVGVTDATAVALVDRSISVLSIIVLGSVAYVLSPKTKGGSRPEVPGRADASPVR